MRIFLSAIVVILGVNLLIDLMDSNLVDVMKERNETIQRQIDQMWQSARCPLFWHSTPKSCILKKWRGFHFTNVLNFSQMRKIESQMIAAIHGNKNWSSGNTQVVTNDGVSTVYLHGNKIALVDDNSMTIFDGGWQSVTTKSRLNALCSEFCIAGEGVFQKDFLWYVRKFVGAINGQNVYQTEDFVSGYVFAWGVIFPLFFIIHFWLYDQNSSHRTPRRYHPHRWHFVPAIYQR